MTPDVIAILGVGLSLAGLIVGTMLPGLRELRREILSLRERMDQGNEGLRDQIAGLQGRMSKVEIGLVQLEAKMKERMTHLEVEMRQRMSHLEAEVRERIAHIEGVIEGFAKEQKEDAS